MFVQSTRHLWLGWLRPDLSDDEVAEDVVHHLAPHAINDVFPERNAMRRGAYVLLQNDMSREQFDALEEKPYRSLLDPVGDKGVLIQIDDESPDCPQRSKTVCPRLTGAANYCRGWNMRGNDHWTNRCRFEHPPDWIPTTGAEAELRMVEVSQGEAKYDEIVGDFTCHPFPEGAPTVLSVTEVINPRLERLYTERKAFLQKMYDGVVAEVELWHGTHAAAVPHVVAHGLQPPSDADAAAACPRSGGKGCTSLCDNRCAHCVSPHRWQRCHMYGLGVYLADLAAKSHRYVRGAEEQQGRLVYTMLRCRTNLGSPHLIDGDLLRADGMHGVARCVDPAEHLDRAEEYDHRRGATSYFVKGQGGATRSGRGVMNNEYVVFDPWQIWPRYVVRYTFDH